MKKRSAELITLVSSSPRNDEDIVMDIIQTNDLRLMSVWAQGELSKGFTVVVDAIGRQQLFPRPSVYMAVPKGCRKPRPCVRGVDLIVHFDINNVSAHCKIVDSQVCAIPQDETMFCRSSGMSEAEWCQLEAWTFRHNVDAAIETGMEPRFISAAQRALAKEYAKARKAMGL